MGEFVLVGQVAGQIHRSGPDAIALVGHGRTRSAPAVERAVQLYTGESATVLAHINLEGYGHGIGYYTTGVARFPAHQ